MVELLGRGYSYFVCKKGYQFYSRDVNTHFGVMTIISYFPVRQQPSALQVLREDTHKQKGMLTFLTETVMGWSSLIYKVS